MTNQRKSFPSGLIVAVFGILLLTNFTAIKDFIGPDAVERSAWRNGWEAVITAGIATSCTFCLIAGGRRTWVLSRRTALVFGAFSAVLAGLASVASWSSVGSTSSGAVPSRDVESYVVGLFGVTIGAWLVVGGLSLRDAREYYSALCVRCGSGRFRKTEPRFAEVECRNCGQRWR